MDDREGVSGEDSSGEVIGGNGKSGDVEGDSGEMDGGEDNDGEQIENTIDIPFNLLQWVCILFVRLQLRFGLTNAAATALAFVSLARSYHSSIIFMFPTNLPGLTDYVGDVIAHNREINSSINSILATCLYTAS